jgi:hypothetical protein
MIILLNNFLIDYCSHFLHLEDIKQNEKNKN